MYPSGSAFDVMTDDYWDGYDDRYPRHHVPTHPRSNGVPERTAGVRQAYRDDYREYRGGRQGQVVGGMGRRRDERDYRSDRDPPRESARSSKPRNHRGEDERHGPDSGEGSRSSSVREVSDHLEQIDLMERGPATKHHPGGAKFLKKVQRELDEQRLEWKDEVDRLTDSSLITTLPKDKQAHVLGTNSYVDTSSGIPIFTAFVDVSEFHPDSVEVDYDHVTNKVVVKGKNMNGIGTMTKTFTQKVQLPRFADDQRLTTKLSRAGILKVEVPLMYYFPEQQKKGRDVKSFVNEVKTNRDGSQTLEILVNTGPGVRAKDLRVEVTDDRQLLVTAKKDGGNGHDVRKLIKRYHLSSRANMDRIVSKAGRDGRLVIQVPLHPH